ncbi:hypothetical protein MNEG_12523 [Monoraphidium neglectum]|uniref:C2H2-type domain-containing protein n=1 Tax=Monoraphidium neglectum TaxID=145388 RepID=A0A0D2LV16_9CHLO|nr:hypothetical protein MNEG_12523 [Monoraphidium neglectum]KIY95439.1 hypothetical protein MNEG_12523 [Monoraphidium neglectum]|eukprot:XP_013894459.1 hypothetical protein MNEG_12523 [Monoraphidium neglectum]
MMASEAAAIAAGAAAAQGGGGGGGGASDLPAVGQQQRANGNGGGSSGGGGGGGGGGGALWGATWQEGGSSLYCYGCLRPLAPESDGLDAAAAEDGPGLVLRCQLCRRLFCFECDAYIHESLHNCPGCECGGAAPAAGGDGPSAGANGSGGGAAGGARRINGVD